MQVIEMLENMALLSVGPDNLTPKTKSIFLKFLNMANREIYNDTASINADIAVNEQITTVANSENVQLKHSIFSVSKVYVNNNYPGLGLKSFFDFTDLKKNNPSEGTPEIFTFRKKVLSIYPIRSILTYNLDIWYAPQPINITETTDEDNIPYPLSFHDLLVDTALYYLFLDEEGFKNTAKNQKAESRAKMRKSQLIAYLYANTNQTLSTFSNV
jgi:hypothetical protein